VAVCQTARINNLVFHDLRHCAVTNLAEAGVEPEVIMQIAGHKSVEMFLRYRKVAKEKLYEAMTKLNTYLTHRTGGTH
jgi:integrase